MTYAQALTPDLDRHRETILRVLATVFFYIGLADDTREAMRYLKRTATAEDDYLGRGITGPARAFAALCDPSTLSRRTHRIIVRHLLPIESAARRLIMVIARRLPAHRLTEREIAHRIATANPPKRAHIRPRHVPGVTVPAFLFATAKPEWKPPVRMPRFCLLDRQKRFFRQRRTANRSFPRIWSFDSDRPPARPAARHARLPDDRISDLSLKRRVAALAAALEDPEAQARRYNRWQALVSVDAQIPFSRRGKRRQRLTALRPGLPPGSAPGSLPRIDYPAHYDVLVECHGLAFHLPPRRDSS